MFRQLISVTFTLIFFISVPYGIHAENKTIRSKTVSKTVRKAYITAGNKFNVVNGGKTYYSNILDGGIEDVFHGGISHNATIQKGGKLWVAGGKAYNATVKDGGIMEIRTPQEKGSYAAGTKILNGGKMNVYNNSLAEKTTIHSGGLLRVFYKRSLVSNVTVFNGGILHVWKHGTAQNVYIAPGGLLDLREDSPVLKGTILIAGQLKASFDQNPDVSQANITVDLSKRLIDHDYAIVNLNYLGSINLSIRIDRNQKNGWYKLASQSNYCNPTWKLIIKGGKSFYLKPGEIKCIDGKSYLLNKGGNDFKLRIADAAEKNLSAASSEKAGFIAPKWYLRRKNENEQELSAIDMKQWQKPDPAIGKWHISLDSAFAEAQAGRKNILIMITGPDWCSPCRTMEKEVFPDPKFTEFAKNLVLVYLVSPRKYKDKSQEVYNRLMFRTLAVPNGVPATILVDYKGQILGKFAGGLRTEKYIRRISAIIKNRTNKTILPAWIKNSPRQLIGKMQKFDDDKYSEAAKAADAMEQVMKNSTLKVEAWGFDKEHIVHTFNPDTLLTLPCNKDIFFKVRYNVPKYINVAFHMYSEKTYQHTLEAWNNGEVFIQKLNCRNPGKDNNFKLIMYVNMPESEYAVADLPCNIVWSEKKGN